MFSLACWFCARRVFLSSVAEQVKEAFADLVVYLDPSVQKQGAGKVSFMADCRVLF